jgi:hypothetical protein
MTSVSRLPHAIRRFTGKDATMQCSSPVSPRAARAALGLLLIGAVACTDRDGVVSPFAPFAPAAPEAGQTAFLTVSSMTPVAGQRIDVSINTLRATNELPVGSYTFRVAYDTAGLRFVETGEQPDGMVIANRAGGALLVGGASGTGFTTSRLATIRLEVLDPRALKSLALTLVDMTATDFGNQARKTLVDRRLFQSNGR